MRQVRYSVAMSLDGYIAGPNGEADWIVMDPDIDFGALFTRFDTLLIGRKTFAAMQAMGGGAGSTPEVVSVVISRTMQQADYPDLNIIAISGADAREELDIVSLSMKLGAVHAFQKPLDLKAFLAVIEELLGEDQLRESDA